MKQQPVGERLSVAFEKQLRDFDVQIALKEPRCLPTSFVDADAVAYRLSVPGIHGF